MSKKRKKKKPQRPQRTMQKPLLQQPKKPIVPQPKNPVATLKTVALSAVMMLSIGVGAWFLLSPTLEKKENLDHQSKLLESISQGSGEITLSETFTVEDVDFYDDGGDISDYILPLSTTENVTPPELEEVVVLPTTQTIKLEKPSITGIGILSIDKIGLKLPVTDGVTDAQLKIALGHVPQTAAIGEIGNAVIAGHRSYTYGDYFNRLGEMVIGDTIAYQSKDGQYLTYKVFEILVVEPGDQTAFVQPNDKSELTLYTCTPIRTATHRLLVRAELEN